MMKIEERNIRSQSLATLSLPSCQRVSSYYCMVGQTAKYGNTQGQRETPSLWENPDPFYSWPVATESLHCEN